MATSEEDAEFEEDDELAADPHRDNDEFAANNQLHNELGQSEEEEEEEEGVSDEDAEGEDEEMAENHGDGESEEESDEDEDGEGVGGMLKSYPCPKARIWSFGTICLSRY
jgi:histone acetyltransferase SAS3